MAGFLARVRCLAPLGIVSGIGSSLILPNYHQVPITLRVTGLPMRISHRDSGKVPTLRNPAFGVPHSNQKNEVEFLQNCRQNSGTRTHDIPHLGLGVSKKTMGSIDSFAQYCSRHH